MNGTSEKLSRFSRASSNMSKFYGLASNTSAQYRTVIMSRQQRKAEKVIAVRRKDVTGGGGSGVETEEKIVCVILHRTVLALWPKTKRGW